MSLATIPISQIMTKTVKTAREEDSVHQAVKTMSEHKISSVVIVGADMKPVGMFTEKDAIRVIAKEKDALGLRLKEVMSSPIISINILTSIKMALVVMATSGIKTLFNLNPLIKLDGYYLLSDYLEIPNLRKRALSYLSAGIKRLWGSVIQKVDEVTPRERRIYLNYGLLAGSYSFILLGLIALKVGGFLIGSYQGWGFILFSGLLMIMFRNPLGKLWKRIDSFIQLWLAEKD